jgi:hypothetical protein
MHGYAVHAYTVHAFAKRTHTEHIYSHVHAELYMCIPQLEQHMYEAHTYVHTYIHSIQISEDTDYTHMHISFVIILTQT